MSEPTIDPVTEPFHIRHRQLILIAITVVAAILRFATLDRPTLWGDEALTYSRVTGTWEEMFSILQNDGFMPLHYILYWLLGKCVTLTPAMMRVIPSLCGVLMVPAMYFMVRQLSTVGAALFAAAFACTSAYLMRYSHDAKMYIQTWAFIALNLGCLFWWLRTRKWAGYFSWIITGMIAGGFSALAMLVLLPQIAVFITARKIRVQSAILFISGAAIIASPVAIYMSMINQWTQKTGVIPSLSSKENPGNWDSSGIGWVQNYNDYSTGATLVRGSLSAYLTGWEWPVYNGGNRVISDFVWASHLGILSFIALASLIAILPWRKPVSDESCFTGWQRFLWIGLLLLIPVYGVFYCRSVNGFNSPIEVLLAGIRLLGYWNLLFIIAIILSWHYSGISTRDRLKKCWPWVISIVLLICMCQVMYWFMNYQHTRHWENMAKAYGTQATPLNMPQLDWQSIWMPRYVGVVIPALVAGFSMLIMRLPGKWIKTPIIVAIIGFNLCASIARLAYSPEPPLDRYMADARQVRDSRGKTRIVISTLDPRHLQKTLFLQSSWYGLYGSAGKYYASIALDLNPSPSEFRDGDLASRYRDFLGELYDPEDIETAIGYRSTDLNQAAQKLIIWDHATEQNDDPQQILQPDRIVQSLAKNWKPVGHSEIFYQYEANCWALKGYNRRREFVRISTK